MNFLHTHDLKNAQNFGNKSPNVSIVKLKKGKETPQDE
jgi:hypothetical protein